MTVHLRPDEIETESFRIIDAEAGRHSWPAHEWPLVRRVIHTSADFDYLHTMALSPDAVAKGVDALRNGRGIVTDTTMALAGINKRLLSRIGVTASCFVADPDVEKQSSREGITRSMAAMRKAAADAGNGIFVIGNAPTALFELIRLMDEEILRPDLVIGVPVGFVGAEESKEALIRTAPRCKTAFITNRGRKGGSTVAAAIVNALLIQADHG